MTPRQRPVDHLNKPPHWKYSRIGALQLGKCGQCGADVSRKAFTKAADRAEYELSSMCLRCQTRFFDDYPDSAWNVAVHDYGPLEEEA